MEFLYKKKKISTCKLLQLYKREVKKIQGNTPYSEYDVCFILFTVHLL